MRILYILNSSVMGGATISFLNLVLNLDRKVVTPIVVIPQDKKSKSRLEGILQNNNIEYHSIALTSSILKAFRLKDTLLWVAKYLLLPFRLLNSYIQLKRVILLVRPDIIHTNVGVVHVGYHLARKYGIPHVWHLREYQTKDFNWYIYPSYGVFCSYLKNSYVITITEAIQRYFKLEGSPKALTIYNGIFRREEIVRSTQKENYFLMASRVSPEKGHSDAIKAFSHFSRKNEYRLVIAGFDVGGYKSKLKDVAVEYQCDDRIDFLDFQNDVKPLMSKAKALIVASYNEGFGRMTAEAAFCSTIVIGRNTAGTKEILLKTGGLFFNTVDEMTTQMETVSTMDETEYSIMAQRAQDVAKSRFSVENNVEKTFDLYRRILQDG